MMNGINGESINESDPLHEKIKELIAFSGADAESFEGDLVGQIIRTSLRMMKEGYNTGQLKLMTRAFKEMRYAYRIFNQYPTTGRRISIFGSARTPQDHADYLAAKSFSANMSNHGWVCITGAANGIMRAGLEGPQLDSSFGLSIRLPFEETSNSLIAGDPKLISFRYFFTRKLMFLSHSDAVAAFPGGFGTQDELFEVLTLMQTGKANIVPVVLVEGQEGDYWQSWFQYMTEHLLKNKWISQEDFNFFYIAPSVDDAVQHIQTFYRRYHSSRYVKDFLVLRLLTPLTQEQVDSLHQEFSAHLLKPGSKIELTQALPEETDHLELPRIMFEHNRRNFGYLRALINHINQF